MSRQVAALQNSWPSGRKRPIEWYVSRFCANKLAKYAVQRFGMLSNVKRVCDDAIIICLAPSHDLPLVQSRQLDEPFELRPRLAFSRSTPLDRAVDREQQRRQGRENHQNEDARGSLASSF